MNVVDNAIEWANHFVGEREVPKDSNRGLVIDDIQKSFGFKGVAYCMLFVLYCYKRACAHFDIDFPFPNIGDTKYSPASSQSVYQWAVDNKYSETDFTKLDVGDIVIWRKFKLWQGHAGLVISVDHNNQTFETIEGNTSDSDFGDQREGGGIYKRVRKMKKADFVVDAFYLRGFISVKRIFNADTDKTIQRALHEC